MGFLRGRLGSQIGRFLRSKIISYSVKNWHSLRQISWVFFFGGGGGGGGRVASPTGATVKWNCHCIKGNDLWPSHIGNGIEEHKNS